MNTSLVAATTEGCFSPEQFKNSIAKRGFELKVLPRATKRIIFWKRHGEFLYFYFFVPSSVFQVDGHVELLPCLITIQIKTTLNHWIAVSLILKSYL